MTSKYLFGQNKTLFGWVVVVVKLTLENNPKPWMVLTFQQIFV